MSLTLLQGPDNILPTSLNSHILEISSMRVGSESVVVTFDEGFATFIDLKNDSTWIVTLSENTDATPLP